MSGSRSWPELRGRRVACDTLRSIVATARAGRSQVLVLRGEAGIGKTALLDFLVDHADGCRIARTAGVESEIEFAYAGLHQLCGPYLDRRRRLPAPQRHALGIAFGHRPGTAPDRFLVGLAVLTLLMPTWPRRSRWSASWTTRSGWTRPRRRRSSSSPAGSAPNRWPWSSPSATIREEPMLDGLPELVLHGLASDDAAALLESAVPGRSMPGSVTGCWPRPTATRWPCWSCRGQLTATELAFGSPARGRRDAPGPPARAGIRAPAGAAATTSPGNCCWPSAAEPVGDVTVLLARGGAARHRDGRGHRGRGRRVDRAAATGSGSAIRSSARPSTARRRPRNGGRSTGPWPTSPTRTSTPPAGPGTALAPRVRTGRVGRGRGRACRPTGRSRPAGSRPRPRSWRRRRR